MHLTVLIVLILIAGIVAPLIICAISNILADEDLSRKIKKQEEKIKAQKLREENIRQETIYD